MPFAKLYPFCMEYKKRVQTLQLTRQKLEWQDEYFAVSVSESQIQTVSNYIKNQKEYHRHNISRRI